MNNKMKMGLAISLGLIMCAASAAILLLIIFSHIGGWSLFHWVAGLAGLIALCGISLTVMALKLEGGSAITTAAALTLAVAVAAPLDAGELGDRPRSPGDGIVAGARAGARILGRAATYDNIVRFIGGINAYNDQQKQALYMINQTTGEMTKIDSYWQGYNAGVVAAYGANSGTYSTIAVGPLNGSPGGFHYMTVCDY